MKEVTVIGSLNIDYIMQVDHLPFKGETIIADSFKILEGGKGANQAVAISKLGIDVNMIGSIGSDSYGDLLLKSLKKSKVNTEGIVKKMNEKTGLAFILIDPNGDNIIVVNPNVNNKLNINDIKRNENLILRSSFVLLQLEIPNDVIEYAISYAKKINKLVILNYSPFKKIDIEIFKNIDFLIMNETELEYLCNMKITNDYDGLVKKLRSFFNKTIIVTLGYKGTMLIDEENKISFKEGYPVSAKDTTGAGDAFIGGFIYSLINGKSIKDSIMIGNLSGAFSVLNIGAQSAFPYKKELENFIKSKS